MAIILAHTRITKGGGAQPIVPKVVRAFGQVIQNSALGTLQCDIAGPVSQQELWTIINLSAMVSDPAKFVGDDLAVSGFYLVPNTQRPVTDPGAPGAASADLEDRYMWLPAVAATDVGGATVSYASWALLSGGIYWPYGYNLRFVATSYAHAGIGPNAKAVINGLVNVEPICPC